MFIINLREQEDVIEKENYKEGIIFSHKAI